MYICVILINHYFLLLFSTTNDTMVLIPVIISGKQIPPKNTVGCVIPHPLVITLRNTRIVTVIGRQWQNGRYHQTTASIGQIVSKRQLFI